MVRCYRKECARALGKQGSSESNYHRNVRCFEKRTAVTKLKYDSDDLLHKVIFHYVNTDYHQ